MQGNHVTQIQQGPERQLLELHSNPFLFTIQRLRIWATMRTIIPIRPFASAIISILCCVIAIWILTTNSLPYPVSTQLTVSYVLLGIAAFAFLWSVLWFSLLRYMWTQTYIRVTTEYVSVFGWSESKRFERVGKDVPIRQVNSIQVRKRESQWWFSLISFLFKNLKDVQDLECDVPGENLILRNVVEANQYRLQIEQWIIMAKNGQLR